MNCIVPGCEKAQRKAGGPYCRGHWRLQLRYGTPTPVCSVEGCGKPIQGHGLCKMHHRRQTVHGSPHITLRPDSYGSGRSLNVHGYVVLTLPTHPLADKKGRVLEHRKVWFEAHGPIPPGYEVHHVNRDRVDNRLENLECMSKSEHWRTHSTRLDEDAVRGVRVRAALGEAYLPIAIDFGITVDHVGRIVRREKRAEVA